MTRMIGIDLGTTKSCVAVMEGGIPQVIPDAQGERTTPSVVSFTADGQVLVGKPARQHASANPENTVSGVLRLLGRKFASPEVTQTRRSLPYRLVEVPQRRRTHPRRGQGPLAGGDLLLCGPEADGRCRGLRGRGSPRGRHHRPRLLQRRAAPGDQECGPHGRPQGLARHQRLHGGRPRLRAQSTGTHGEFVAVYDLGGGTFDITILEVADGLGQVRATGGDACLGGEDFDQRIIDWLIGEFQRETGIDLTQDRMALQRLKGAAENAKLELGIAQQTEIVLPFISTDASGPKHLNTVLTRQRHEELTDALLERTIEACRRRLADAQMRPEQIDEVLLVGGQTRNPKVTEVVRRVFGKVPNRTVSPDVGAAMGRLS